MYFIKCILINDISVKKQNMQRSCIILKYCLCVKRLFFKEVVLNSIFKCICNYSLV